MVYTITKDGGRKDECSHEIIGKENMGWCANTNSKDIAQKILEAYNNRKKFEEMSKKEIMYSTNNFNWNKIANETIESYEKIIKEYRRKQNEPKRY